MEGSEARSGSTAYFFFRAIVVGAVGFEPTQSYWHCHSFTASLSLQGMRTHEDVEFLLRQLVRILSTVSE